MKALIEHLKAMHMYFHFAHLAVARASFIGDHKYFKDAYEAIFDDLDSVIERGVGLFSEALLSQIAIMFENAVIKVKSLPVGNVADNRVFFENALALEQTLCDLIANLAKSATVGTEQLVTEIANKSEVRQYKIKQRLK